MVAAGILDSAAARRWVRFARLVAGLTGDLLLLRAISAYFQGTAAISARLLQSGLGRVSFAMATRAGQSRIRIRGRRAVLRILPAMQQDRPAWELLVQRG